MNLEVEGNPIRLRRIFLKSRTTRNKFDQNHEKLTVTKIKPCCDSRWI